MVYLSVSSYTACHRQLAQVPAQLYVLSYANCSRTTNEIFMMCDKIDTSFTFASTTVFSFLVVDSLLFFFSSQSHFLFFYRKSDVDFLLFFFFFEIRNIQRISSTCSLFNSFPTLFFC